MLHQLYWKLSGVCSSFQLDKFGNLIVSMDKLGTLHQHQWRLLEVSKWLPTDKWHILHQVGRKLSLQNGTGLLVVTVLICHPDGASGALLALTSWTGGLAFWQKSDHAEWSQPIIFSKGH